MSALVCLLGLLGAWPGSRGQLDGYCFSFTWLGPVFQNTSEEPNNTLCNEVTTSPCVLPLVNSAPIYSELWHNATLRENFTCRLDRSSVCAKWINYYDKEVVNVSHICTKISVQGEGAMKEGCLTHYKGVYSTEVCACRTLSPHSPPCNYATIHTPALQLPVVLLIAVSAAFNEVLGYW
ncbi:uncharacterized protein [Periplaneta americana]|uniref:uncharacterized protein n=1 Tax=Periplaneta americana TaxID=6978 RepID=UPI0037E86CD4